MSKILKRLTALFFRHEISRGADQFTPARLEVGPGDTVVVTHPGALKREQVDAIRKMVADQMPDGVRTLVLSHGLTLQVVAGQVKGGGQPAAR